MQAPSTGGARRRLADLSRRRFERLARGRRLRRRRSRRFRMLIEVDGVEAHARGRVGRAVGPDRRRGRCIRGPRRPVPDHEPRSRHRGRRPADARHPPRLPPRHRRPPSRCRSASTGVCSSRAWSGWATRYCWSDNLAPRMSRMEDRVRVEVSDHVATVTLARADKHNALDRAMFDAIVAAAEQVARHSGRQGGRAARRRPQLLLGDRRDERVLGGRRPRRRVGGRPHDGSEPLPAHRVRLGHAARAGDRGDPRQLPRRRAPDRARSRHQDRHPRRPPVGDGGQMGPDSRHVDHPDAAAPGRDRRRQGADVHRARVLGGGGARARSGHRGWPTIRWRRRASSPPRSPDGPRTPSGEPSGCSTSRGAGRPRRRSRSRPRSSSS